MRNKKLKYIFVILTILIISAFVILKIKSKGSNKEITKEITPTTGFTVKVSSVSDLFEKHDIERMGLTPASGEDRKSVV